MTTDRTYSTAEVMEHTGATKRQVQSWTEQGWLCPEPRAAATSGVPLAYSAVEVQVCAYAVCLTNMGVMAERALRDARSLAENGRVVHRAGDVAMGLWVTHEPW